MCKDVGCLEPAALVEEDVSGIADHTGRVDLCAGAVVVDVPVLAQQQGQVLKRPDQRVRVRVRKL